VRRRTVKTVGFFDPLPSVSEELCDRYYTSVHVPLIVDVMRGMDISQTYHTAKALFQRDPNGGWSQRSEVWRSVSIRVSIAEGSGPMPEATRSAIEQDHRRFLSGLRTYLCREEIMCGNIRRHPPPTKFIIEIGSSRGQFASARSRVYGFKETLGSILNRDGGVVLGIWNEVRCQERARTLDFPGQGFSPGEFISEPDAVALVELYVEAAQAGEEVINALQPHLVALQGAPTVGAIRCFRFLEECQLEHSRPDD